MAKKQTQFWKRRLKRTRKRLHLLLVPQRNNHYRPLLVRRYGLLVVIGLAIGLQFGYNFSHTGSVLGRVVTVTPAGLLAATNDKRAEHDLPPFQLNQQLNSAAASKARDMLFRGYWDHVSPEGVEPWEWIEGAGYSYQQAGENLAKNFSTAGATITAWMNSEPHRDNVLNSEFRDVGFATVYGDIAGEPSTITVAMYALPAEQPQVAAATGSNVLPTIAEGASLAPATRMGVALQSLTPAAIISLALLLVAVTVAVSSHFHRSKLPKKRRESWYKNHGAVKASGLLSIAAFIVLLYGGGQI